MEESEKYYTPIIEEFHHGFEYEFHGMTTGGLFFLDQEMNQIHGRDPDIKIWSKEQCVADITVETFHSCFRPIKEIPEILKRGQIRVKVLDKEDVESFGFVRDPKASHKERWNLEKYLNGRTVGVTLLEGGDVTIYIWDGTRERIIFDGIIKNKSEFARLLKQLGI